MELVQEWDEGVWGLLCVETFPRPRLRVSLGVYLSQRTCMWAQGKARFGILDEFPIS